MKGLLLVGGYKPDKNIFAVVTEDDNKLRTCHIFKWNAPVGGHDLSIFAPQPPPQAVPVMQAIQKAFVGYKSYKPPAPVVAAAESSYESVTKRPSAAPVLAASESSYETVAKRPSAAPQNLPILQNRDSGLCHSQCLISHEFLFQAPATSPFRRSLTHTRPRFDFGRAHITT